MTWLDYTILGIVGTSMGISLIRGFVRELFSIVTWVAAFFVGFQFSDNFAMSFGPWIESNTFRHILSFMLLFTCTLLVGSTVSHFVTGLLRKTGFGITDRLLGVFFGFTRGVLLVGVLLMIGSFTEFTVTQPWARSSLIPTFQPMTSWLIKFMPKDIHKKIEDSASKMNLPKQPDATVNKLKS